MFFESLGLDLDGGLSSSPAGDRPFFCAWVNMVVLGLPMGSVALVFSEMTGLALGILEDEDQVTDLPPRPQLWFRVLEDIDTDID